MPSSVAAIHPFTGWKARRCMGTNVLFEAKFMLPWTFSEEGAAEKHMGPIATQYVGHRFGIGRSVSYYGW
jgi:hypothetical protein